MAHCFREKKREVAIAYSVPFVVFLVPDPTVWVQNGDGWTFQTNNASLDREALNHPETLYLPILNCRKICISCQVWAGMAQGLD